jgi:hypothetical protein
MSARKATKKLADEIAAKKAKKDFMDKSEKQIATLMKNILKKYPKDCSNCIERNQGMETDSRQVDYEDRHGNYVYSKTEYDASIRKSFGNSCNHKIKIIGIQQKHSQEKGYYYEEVARTMDANEKHEVKQGIFSYIFTALVGLQDDIYLQDKYCIECASINSIQWIRVVKN